MEVKVEKKSTVGGAGRVECRDLTYLDKADVSLVKSWSGFAGNRAAEMQDIALNLVLLRAPEKVDSTRRGNWRPDKSSPLASRCTRIPDWSGRMVPANSTIRAIEQRRAKHAGEIGELMVFPIVYCESRLQGFHIARGQGNPS